MVTNNSKLIHVRITDDLNKFIDEMADTPEFHNRTHVITFALEQLRRTDLNWNRRKEKCKDDVKRVKKWPVSQKKIE